jgi:hypothetical protein
MYKILWQVILNYAYNACSHVRITLKQIKVFMLFYIQKKGYLSNDIKRLESFYKKQSFRKVERIILKLLLEEKKQEVVEEMGIPLISTFLVVHIIS